MARFEKSPSKKQPHPHKKQERKGWPTGQLESASAGLFQSAVGGDGTPSPEAHRSLSSQPSQRAQETVHEVGGVVALHDKGPRIQNQTTNLGHPRSPLAWQVPLLP